MSADDHLPLAVFGGRPDFPQGPPSWPRRDPRIHEALERSWRDGSWGQYLGPHCEMLSQRLATFHEVEHTMLTCSGTIAVELALRGLGVDRGDVVLMAGYDFPGNFRAIEAIGARPLLCDTAPGSFVVAADMIARTLKECGSAPSAILVSHLHGAVANMPGILQSAGQFNVPVVEDACQALGGEIDGKRLGTFGDIGVLSFGGSKLLTAGRGGALLSNDASAIQRCRVFSERGNQAFPLSELQAAVLLPQLADLTADTATRAGNAKLLAELTGGIDGLKPVEIPPDTWLAAYFKFGFHFSSSATAWPDRDQFVSALSAEGIAVGAGFRGFAKRSSRRCDRATELTACAKLARETVVLHHPILLDEQAQIARLARCLQKVANATPV